MIRNILLSFSFSLIGLLSFAAPVDSVGVTKINDKIHIKYLVEPGETIYGISSKYGVSVADLIEINPALENGLKVGQIINIPYNPDVKQAKADDDNIYHTVQPGETLYSLSKKYNVPVGELLKYNNMELKVGQKLIVGHKDKKPSEVVSDVKKENKEVVNTPATNSAVPPADVYHYDPSRKQVLFIPFDPYLYFSDCDDEIAAKSNLPRNKVRQVFRKRLNALLEAPAYENIYLLGGKAKDTISDLNKIYQSVTYVYQKAIDNPYYRPSKGNNENSNENGNVKEEKSWLDKQKDKFINGNEGNSKYNIPDDYGSYFGVKIKNPDAFFNYFNTKYSVDYYVFINQFEVKTNYENCLDRAAQNYERTFTTHFSIFDSTGKQVAGNKFKTHYNSNSNYIFQIVADNMPKVAERILAEIPPANK